MKKINVDDILSNKKYGEIRKQKRADLISYKKKRRINVGPYATFYFESYKTMLYQVQEMLFVEGAPDGQLEDELHAYNPLIPQGSNLVTTLMFEIADENLRHEFLSSVGNVEEYIFMEIGSDKIKARFESDVERTNSKGKTSSVHFLHFDFTEDQKAKFLSKDQRVCLCIEHKNYNHIAVLGEDNLKTFYDDFSS